MGAPAACLAPSGASSCPVVGSGWGRLLMDRWAGGHPVYVAHLGFKVNPLSHSGKYIQDVGHIEISGAQRIPVVHL